MTQILLCAGSNLLVIKKDGQLFYRRPGQPDAPVPYAPEYYPVFLNSARQKHGLTPVLGASGEEAPYLADSADMPVLFRDRLASGEEVYRLLSAGERCGDGNHTAKSSGNRTYPLTI